MTDARAALRYLRQRHPGEPLVAVGVSLDGAALLLGEERPDVDALVLEAVYPDLRQALRNRLRLRGGLPATWLEPLLASQLQWRTGIEAEEVRPIDRIGEVRVPVLIIAGERDRRTMLAESRNLFEAAGAKRKEMWVVEGAEHVDLQRCAPEAYEIRLGDFLAQSARVGHRGGSPKPDSKTAAQPKQCVVWQTHRPLPKEISATVQSSFGSRG